MLDNSLPNSKLSIQQSFQKSIMKDKANSKFDSKKSEDSNKSTSCSSNHKQRNSISESIRPKKSDTSASSIKQEDTDNIMNTLADDIDLDDYLNMLSLNPNIFEKEKDNLIHTNVLTENICTEIVQPSQSEVKLENPSSSNQNEQQKSLNNIGGLNNNSNTNNSSNLLLPQSTVLYSPYYLCYNIPTYPVITIPEIIPAPQNIINGINGIQCIQGLSSFNTNGVQYINTQQDGYLLNNMSEINPNLISNSGYTYGGLNYNQQITTPRNSDYILNQLYSNMNNSTILVSIIKNMLPLDMFEVSNSNLGKEILINLYKELENEQTDRSKVNYKCINLSNMLFEKMKEYLYFYIINYNPSCILIKVLRFNHFFQRLTIWKVVESYGFMSLAAGKSTSHVLINLINTLNDKVEEEYITKLLSKRFFLKTDEDETEFEQNLLYLSTLNSFTNTVLQSIIGRFSNESLLPYLNFIEKNFMLLFSSSVANKVLSKYVRVLRMHNHQQKKKTLHSTLKYISILSMNDFGVELLVQIIEDWGIAYIKTLVKSCFKIESLFTEPDYKADKGICAVFSKLLWNKNKVRF